MGSRNAANELDDEDAEDDIEEDEEEEEEEEEEAPPPDPSFLGSLLAIGIPLLFTTAFERAISAVAFGAAAAEEDAVVDEEE